MRTMEAPRERRPWLVPTIFAVVVLPASLYGFGAKFLEFVAIFRGQSDGAFAVTPIVNYVLASLGFFCLLCWATLQGMFRDVEQPKRDFLDREAELDRI